MLMIGSMRGSGDFLIIFLLVFDTMRAISLEDGLQAHAAPSSFSPVAPLSRPLSTWY